MQWLEDSKEAIAGSKYRFSVHWQVQMQWLENSTDELPEESTDAVARSKYRDSGQKLVQRAKQSNGKL